MTMQFKCLCSLCSSLYIYLVSLKGLSCPDGLGTFTEFFDSFTLSCTCMCTYTLFAAVSLTRMLLLSYGLDGLGSVGQMLTIPTFAVKFPLSETLCAFVCMFYYLHAISQL